jgi:DNA gyrase/topoisomerase IV subunit B
MDKLLVTDFGFGVLMGDKVESGREFIEKHALRAENLLFHTRWWCST